MSTGDFEDGAATPEACPSLTLADYVGLAGTAIREGLPKRVWVEAVVLDAKERRAGLTLELVEPRADAKHNAFLRCYIPQHACARIGDEIGAPLDVRALKGKQAKLLLKPSFHPHYHLQGEVLGLDPNMVASLVAARIEDMRQTLIDLGFFGLQGRLPAPRDVISVAVIHPEQAAGWADVYAELDRFEVQGILTVTSHACPFEGRVAGDRMAAMIQAIGNLEDRPDLILIVRGGGAAAGLAQLSDLALARAVCQCPVPVVTGIGHATDRTLLDEVAWHAADTPSKALGIVKSILRQHCHTAIADRRTIVTGLERLIIQTYGPLLEAQKTALIERVEKMVARCGGGLREARHRVECHVIRFRGEIDTTQASLDRIAADLVVEAPRVPRRAQVAVGTLHRGIVRAARARLPGNDTLAGLCMTRDNAAARLLARCRADLAVSLSAIELALRRRLGDEATRLTQAKSAVEALDATATLRRGYALPLDGRRKIIRSAAAAKAAARFELLFVDGAVACRSADRP